MKRIDYLPSAEADLLEILLTIAADNEPAAHRFDDKLRKAVRRLTQYPLSAPARADVRTDLRGLNVGSYVVYYRVGDEDVLIVRILHGKRSTEEITFD